MQKLSTDNKNLIDQVIDCEALFVGAFQRKRLLAKEWYGVVYIKR